jgi:hypothetical protein
VDSRAKSRIGCDAQKGLSQREIAGKHGITQPYVNKILQRGGLTAYKKERVPAVSVEQQDRQRKRIDRLYRSLLYSESGDLDFVIDDESYFSLSSSCMPGNAFYYATSRGDAPTEMRQSPQKMFEQKVLVWLAISNKGVSEAFFCHSTTMNKNLYISECIHKRLFPFLLEHHSDGNYLFWPDLASCHYAKDTINFLEEEGINFVPQGIESSVRSATPAN